MPKPWVTRRQREVPTAWVVGSAVLAAVLCAAGAATAEPECIAQSAKDALSVCPGGGARAGITKKRVVSVGGVTPPPAKVDKTAAPAPPAPPKETSERDARAIRLKPKQKPLLLTEIANVERLLASTPKSNTKERPGYLRRLAEDYVELESGAFRDEVLAEEEAQKKRASDAKGASEAKEAAKRAGDTVKVARKSAIRYYTALKDEYPTWCQFPDAPAAQQGCVDEVLYYLAYEHELAGDLEGARAAYLELTESHKTSRYVPRAYLAFGEFYFQEAQGDPSKWPFAQSFYKKVLEYDSPEDVLWGYAAYKLGYVYWNQNDYAAAIAQFKGVIEFAGKYPNSPNAAGLLVSARRDIIPVFAQKGDSAKAYELFRPLAGDGARTFQMLEDLGQHLLDTGRYDEAVTVYGDLIKRNANGNGCAYQAHISDAVMASKSGNKPAIVAQLGEQLAGYLALAKTGRSDESKRSCANTTAALLAETAMSWHLEVVGSGDVRGTGDPKTMELSTKLYAMVLANFSEAQFKDFTFPRIVKQDWPSIAKIQYLMADLLYFQKDWEACAKAFDQVVQGDPSGPDAAEAAYAAVLCWQNVYLKDHGDGAARAVVGHAGSLEPRPLSDEQKGMIGAFDHYLCYIEAPENPRSGTDADALDRYVEVAYARARTYYEAQHWQEAAEAFRDVATRFPKHDASIYAAHLALDALNVLASKLATKNLECGREMQTDVPKYLQSFCSGADQQHDGDSCKQLERIQRDLSVAKAVGLVARADAGAPDRIKLYEQAADLYYDAWKKYGERDCREKSPACSANDKILFNGAQAFQAARLIAKAIKLRSILLDPAFGLDQTDAARLAVYLIGGNYQSMAVYEDAAQWYERFAEESPTYEKAGDALSDAVVLRLGLGHKDKAIDDASAFGRRFGAKNPAKAAQIAFAVGAHYAEREDWQNAERALAPLMAKIDQQASLDVKLQAHAMLGRSYAALKRDADAGKHYALVRDGYGDPEKVVKELGTQGGNEAQRARRVGKTVTAVGEALYYFAAKKRAEADRLRMPEYQGGDDEASVAKFVGTKVATWYEKKETAIVAAQREYFKIVELAPAPPPRWVIQAGAAVGSMWGGFIEDFMRAPYPKLWDSAGFVSNTEPPLAWQELRARYQAELHQAIERKGFDKAARRAYESCLGYSVKYQYFDASSRACEKWLAKNYAKQYHVIDEFKGQSSRVNSPLDEQPQVLDYDGQPILLDTRQDD